MVCGKHQDAIDYFLTSLRLPVSGVVSKAPPSHIVLWLQLPLHCICMMSPRQQHEQGDVYIAIRSPDKCSLIQHYFVLLLQGCQSASSKMLVFKGTMYLALVIAVFLDLSQ